MGSRPSSFQQLHVLDLMLNVIRKANIFEMDDFRSFQEAVVRYLKMSKSLRHWQISSVDVDEDDTNIG